MGETLADVFISYSRTDKPRVAPIVAALEAKGWSIWWDMDLAPGEEFDDVTAAALESARAVMVVWTPTSVASRWVRGEARVGADRGVLVPVRFENAQLPIDVRAIHTTDLDDWGGDVQNPAFRLLNQSLTAMLGEPASDRLPCVGRARELERVKEMVGRAKRGDGGLVLFSGEAGVGKSRMAWEAERMAQDAGFTVLRGHCSNMDSSPPYQPALEQIEQIARTLGPALMRASMGENATEISKLMPELRQQYSDIPAYPALPPEQERRYLLHGIAEFVARGARNRPIMLIYEDLHWADESTCILLRYTAERLKGEPVLLVGCYRDSELSSGAPFGRVLQDLIRARLVEDLRLSRLTSAEIVELLMRQFGSEPPPALIELIYSKTEGNPFFVEEVIRHLKEVGQLLTDTGKFREDINVSDTEVTRGVRLIIEDRIERAGEHCREVLTIAAVAGRTFAFDLLVRADSKHDEDDILDAIEEAEGKHLIEDISQDRVARYRFVHEQIRQTLASGLSLPRRQRLHLRIADALESNYAATADQHASEIGHHLYQAGSTAEPVRTARYLTIAGERASAAFAFEDALRQYDLALSILKDQGEEASRARLQGLRAIALQGAERIPDSLEALTAAVALAPSRTGKDDFVLQRCRMLLDIWRGSEAVEDLEQLLSRVHDGGDAARELEVQMVLARAYYVMSLDNAGYPEKCRAAYERAIDLARAQGASKPLAHALVATAQLTDYWPEYRATAIAHLEEAQAVARATGDEEVDIDVATQMLGILHGSAADGERLLERLIARRDPVRLNAHYFRMMWSTYGAGQPERCVEICDAGIELAYRIGTLPVQYPTIKALALLELGDYGAAWTSLDAEIADESHRFGAALQAMGRLDYEISVGDCAAALARAPHVISESKFLVRAWMLRWISGSFSGMALAFRGETATLDRIDALIADTGHAPTNAGRAAMALARGDTAAARALLGEGAGDRAGPGAGAALMAQWLAAEIEVAEQNWEVAHEVIATAIETARTRHDRNRLWRLLGEQARIESTLRLTNAAAASRAEARALLGEIAATIPDPERRACLDRIAASVELEVS